MSNLAQALGARHAPPRSSQEMFDRVVLHLFTQGRRSENAFNCLYRGPEGVSCAIGCLIPDDEYEPACEGNDAAALELLPSVKRLLELDMSLTMALQRLHDTGSNWTDHDAMAAACRRLAEKHELSAAVLDAVPRLPPLHPEAGHPG